MEAASPARLYAAAGGALLLVLGIVGFFYSASFGAPGEVEAALGVLRVNAWLNLLYVATGALGLLAAGYRLARLRARRRRPLHRCSRSGASRSIRATRSLGFLPAAGGDEALQPGARPARPRRRGRHREARSAVPNARWRRKEPRSSEPRAQAAGEGP